MREDPNHRHKTRKMTIWIGASRAALILAAVASAPASLLPASRMANSLPSSDYGRNKCVLPLRVTLTSAPRASSKCPELPSKPGDAEQTSGAPVAGAPVALCERSCYEWQIAAHLLAIALLLSVTEIGITG